MHKPRCKIPLLVGAIAAVVPAMAAAQVAEPAVPAGWKLLFSVRGDLNRDGQADLVRVIEEDNPAKHLKNDGLGQSVLNTNPRRLLVFLQQNGTYQPVVDTDQFLPPVPFCCWRAVPAPVGVAGNRWSHSR